MTGLFAHGTSRADQRPGATSVQVPVERSCWQACSAWARVIPDTRAVKRFDRPWVARTTSVRAEPPAAWRAVDAALRAKFSEAKLPKLTDQRLPPPAAPDGGGTVPIPPKAEADAGAA